MAIELELQIATNVKTLPHPAQFKEWIRVIFSDKVVAFDNIDEAELTIRVVDEEEMLDLNSRYRHKKGLTNVLSFPGMIEEQFDYHVLGDIVICAAVIEQEAKEANKELLSHWAHMVVHGVLHLLGYDHEREQEAMQMEALEIDLMQQLGFASPYEYGEYIENR